MKKVEYVFIGGYSFGKPHVQLTYEDGEVELLPFHKSVAIRSNGISRIVYSDEISVGDTIVEVIN